MKTELKVNYTINNCTFEMTISDIMNDEEFNIAKNNLRREMKYFIKDMADKMPQDKPDAVKVSDISTDNNQKPLPSKERNTPTQKQIETLLRHNIHSVDGVPIEQLDKNTASNAIKYLFMTKNIEPAYTYQPQYSDEELSRFPEEGIYN